MNLQQTHPDLILEWDYERNHPLLPENVTAGSHKKVWWKCSVAEDHQWEATILARAKKCGTKCPCCQNRKTVPSNCLLTTHPKLCEQWDYERNNIKPTEITCGCNNKVWWKCSIAEDHKWESPINSRIIYNLGCPFCSGRYASISNNIAITHPYLLKEWDYEKNKLSPAKFTMGHAKKVWWICKNNHHWQATINNRTNSKQKCPYCTGKKPDNKTSLLAKYPDICEEWDEENKITPNDILPNSHNKIWWKCKKDPTHRWQTTPNNRISNKSVCPYCQISAGEYLVRKNLEQLSVNFSQQYRFVDCKYKKQLPFDFAIHSKKLSLVEFQGQQHFSPVHKFGGTKAYEALKLRDKIKKEYCIKNNIPLLEIKYDQINKIPEILSTFIKSLN